MNIWNLPYTIVNGLEENKRNRFVWEPLKSFKFGGQFLYKAVLVQSLPFVGFYHRLKYLYNIQNHSVCN
jgi:hypothetical protein